MSWFIGVINKKSNVQSNFSLNGIHPKPLYKFQTRNIQFVCGGCQDTCLFDFQKKNSESYSGWLVCGTGIKEYKRSFNFMNKLDWKNIFDTSTFDFQQLNGHFITFVFNQKDFIFRNDQLGLRDCYFTETEDIIAFSTRLDWLVKIRNDCEIDLDVYSSRWQLINSLSYKSFITNIKRLGPGGTAEISSGCLKIKNTHWLPEYAPDSELDSIITLVKKLSLFPLERGYKLNLALSGGLDSRTLLSILLSDNSKEWNVLTFGEQQLPDMIISKKISEYYEIEHDILYRELPSSDKCVTKLIDYTSQTNAAFPVYTCWELGYYEIMDKAKVLIDGGKGGLLRRILANKLLLIGKSALQNKNINKLYTLLHISKPSIFNIKAEKSMQYSATKQIEKMINSMPDINEFGAGNWVDLFNLRYRTANTGNLSQTRVDNYLLNYMPFIQPSLLKKIFQTPEKIRSKAKINKNILRENKILMKFPLVKYDTIIPFEFNFHKAYISAKLHKKIGYYYRSDLPIKFLDNISEYVQDLVRTIAVINYEHYNYKYIKQIVDEYYNGKKENALKVNWWLSFDVWRKLTSHR